MTYADFALVPNVIIALKINLTECVSIVTSHQIGHTTRAVGPESYEMNRTFFITCPTVNFFCTKALYRELGKMTRTTIYLENMSKVSVRSKSKK